MVLGNDNGDCTASWHLLPYSKLAELSSKRRKGKLKTLFEELFVWEVNALSRCSMSVLKLIGFWGIGGIRWCTQ
ncbi:hypothetical protein SDJN03_15583, partial [Cucurbita argyrosperma subsp. sororia]